MYVYLCVVCTQTYAHGYIDTHVLLFIKFFFLSLTFDHVTHGCTRHPPVPLRLSAYTRIYGNHCVSENKDCGTRIQYRARGASALGYEV